MAGEITHAGLCNLEYRGYDSWGIAERVRDEFVIHREVGKISQSEYYGAGAHEAIGHSRWATHGRVTEENAHPHTVGKVTLVHNGIIENHDALRAKMEQEGYVFSSQTDTEVAAALVDHLSAQGLTQSQLYQEVYRSLEGRYAIVWMHQDTPGLYALRAGSPLVVGIDKDLSYIASDSPAFVEHTQSVHHLEDGEAAYMYAHTREYWDISRDTQIEKTPTQLEYQKESVSKGEYEHFMLKEIHDQHHSVVQGLEQQEHDLAIAREMIHQSREVYLVGCGTAHAVALWGQYMLQERAGIATRVSVSSELSLWRRHISTDTVIITLSQSGETADTLEAVEMAQSRGARVVALTNVVSSTLAARSQVVLPLQSGVEKSVASTKAATAMMAVLWRLASVGATKYAQISRGIATQLEEEYTTQIRGIAHRLAPHSSVYIIGRESLYPIALESAIKIAEVSYIHAQGFAAGELKHGPLALIEEGTACVVLGDDPHTRANAAELAARGAWIVGVSEKHLDVYDEWIPSVSGVLIPGLSTLVAMQLLAYHTALARGLDPDMPRNLAKSVTVK